MINQIALGESSHLAGQTVLTAGNFQPLSNNGDNIEKQPESDFYRCHHLTGGAKHPGLIVETPGLGMNEV